METNSNQTSINLNAKLFTVREAAELLGLTERGLRHRIHRGEGPHIIRLGPATIRIHEDDIRAWLRVEEGGS
ncbi:MAG: helix-turn-helix domain-containing protein [Sumerlaeia bacterium]